MEAVDVDHLFAIEVDVAGVPSDAVAVRLQPVRADQFD